MLGFDYCKYTIKIIKYIIGGKRKQQEQQYSCQSVYQHFESGLSPFFTY